MKPKTEIESLLATVLLSIAFGFVNLNIEK